MFYLHLMLLTIIPLVCGYIWLDRPFVTQGLVFGVYLLVRTLFVFYSPFFEIYYFISTLKMFFVLFFSHYLTTFPLELDQKESFPWERSMHFWIILFTNSTLLTLLMFPFQGACTLLFFHIIIKTYGDFNPSNLYCLK